MKNSKYNIFFPFKDYIVGYNSLENDFVFLLPELYAIFEKASNDDVNRLRTIHPNLWNVLENKKFIIPDDTDELKLVKNLVHSIDCDPKQYHLIINPTMDCNFRCWYCYESHMHGSKMDNEIIARIKKHLSLKLQSEQIKNLAISWFGGEPLLYFKQVILPILEFSHDLTSRKGVNFNSNFTSNGFLLNKYMIEEFNRLNVNSIQITLDGDRERHNKVRNNGKGSGSYDTILRNIKTCLTHRIYVSCRINISKDTLPGIYNIINDFKDLKSAERQYIDFSFNKVWQEKMNLNDEFMKLIERFQLLGFNTKYNMFNDTVRNSCYADKENQATINYNGDVYKCTARDFAPSIREGFLDKDGNIYWNNRYYERMDAKFKNKPCLLCKILPICNGSCSQKALESKGIDYCIHNYSEKMKIDIIKNKLINTFSK